MNWPPGSHASTFGGNPVSCAAALETIALLEEELIENSARQGEFLMEGLHRLATVHDLIGDVRGKGLMVGAEIVANRKAKTPSAGMRDALVQSCFRHGLLLLGCGENTIRFCPPLVVDRGQVATALEIFDVALSEVAAEYQHGETAQAR